MNNIILVSTFLVLYTLLFSPVHGTTTSLCSQTPYPEICNSFMVSSHENKATLITHRNSALSATMAQAERACTFISAVNMGSFDQHVKSAWTDCLELYKDSVIQVNRSMASTNNNDIQTWLSTAMTNYETCHDGFIDFNLSSLYTDSFSFMLTNVSKFLSNSLAINKALASQSSVRPTERRRLVARDWPEWISATDRKLLLAVEPKGDVVVAKDGSGDYKTISEAVAASASRRSGDKRFVIYVKRGVYNENVEVEKSMDNLMLVGDGIDATIVTASKNSADGSTTFRSATFSAVGRGFIARGITFENTAGPEKHQAVAFLSKSDVSVLYLCSFKGYQDTLYVHSGRQFYRQCDIYGTQDFIFGNAAAILQNSNIYVRKPMSNQKNTITAQGRTDNAQNSGIVAHNSRVTAASDLRPVQGTFKTYLGRPWKTYSRTVFMKCFLDGLIDSEGWLPWNGDFALKTLYYGEYGNSGSGSGTSGRVKWPGYHVITSADEAMKFTVGSMLDGNSWLVDTGVPFTSGL